MELKDVFMFHARPSYKDSRREIERQDARELREDHSAMANLSGQFIHREWQKNNPHPSPTKNDVVHNSDFGV